MDVNNNQHGRTLALSIPVTHPELFSHRATADVLAVLADNVGTGFGIRELGRILDRPHRSVSQAVSDLEAVDAVETEREGPKKLVRINSDRLSDPDDPVVSVPQSTFHQPVRVLCRELRTELTDERGIVLFGSVARGTADRQSDIDCFVLVDDDQAVNQQAAHDVVARLHDERFDGERYTFEVLVESVRTAGEYGDRLQEIFAEGITLSDSDDLQQLKREVLADGS